MLNKYDFSNFMIMNKTLVIAAIAMFVVVLGVSAAAPAFAISQAGSSHANCFPASHDNSGTGVANLGKSADTPSRINCQV